jgi:DNA-binding beta-propeller fold protein YncE
MNKVAMLFLAALAAVAGCSSSDSGTGGSAGTGGVGGGGATGGAGGDPRACASDIDVGEVQAFGDPTPTRTEGLVFAADGTLYVSAQDNDGPDQLLEVSLDGSNESVAEAESLLGLESHSSGILAAGIRTANLLLIDPSDGSNDEIATGLGEPNFVVNTPWGTTLVSDDRPDLGSILEVTSEGAVSTWSDGVPTPNGMVFSLDGSTLYVAATFQEAGLWRIPVSDGMAGTAEKWVAYETSAPDGVAIDSEGNVYVALNTAGQIAKVDAEGNSSTLADELRGVGPASIAFGQGEFDPCSLYVTSLFTTQMYRIGTGVLGVEK